ncbi:riboflavin synthase [Candidatus Margulisiibacteriota bacterium]
MFTGIIKDVGVVKKITLSGDFGHLVVTTTIAQDAGKGDSIAVNGVCLTVTKISQNDISFDIAQSTLALTCFSMMRKGLTVNVETAMKAGDPFGGHIVSGHVDTVGTIVSFTKQKDTTSFIQVQFEEKFASLVIDKGSIALDGSSLTIGKIINPTTIEISILPYTLLNTNLMNLSTGDPIHLEFDIVGKYVQNYMSSTNKESVSKDFLQKTGFLKT